MKIETNNSMRIVRDMPCQNCGQPIPEARFFGLHEPIIGLCARCQEAACREDYGNTREVEEYTAKPMRVVVAECQPGKSTGRPRRSAASMGEAENANGCWDNIVPAMEGD